MRYIYFLIVPFFNKLDTKSEKNSSHETTLEKNFDDLFAFFENFWFLENTVLETIQGKDDHFINNDHFSGKKKIVFETSEWWENEEKVKRCVY